MSGIASIIVLILVLTISMTVVKIGSVMLRMTGLDVVTANFQALSAFTGTGFTTRESESVVSHERRRKIIRSLMILGNAGMAVAIATLFNMVSRIQADSWQDYSRYAVVLSGCVIYIIVLSNKRFNRWLTRFIQRRLSTFTDLKIDELEHMLAISEGAGVAGLEVSEAHPVANRSLRDLALPRFGILVLAVHRGSMIVSAPSADFIIRPDDRVICYGHVDKMRVLLAGEQVQSDNEVSLTRLFENINRRPSDDAE